MLNIRQITDRDWEETIPSWYGKYGDAWPLPQRHMMPDNGLGGAIVSSGDTPFACGMLYYTNSSIAIIEFVIADKDYREDDRDEGIELVLSSLKELAKSKGCEVIFAWVKNKSLINKYNNTGFLNSAECTELVTKL